MSKKKINKQGDLDEKKLEKEINSTANKLIILNILSFLIIGLLLYGFFIGLPNYRKKQLKENKDNAVAVLKKEGLTDDEIKNLDLQARTLQKDYAKYLINTNDNLIKLERKGTDIFEKYDKLSNVGKEENKINYTEKLEKVILRQAALLQELENNEPNDKNDKYNEIYKSMMEGHLYMSQGLISQLEYMYDNDKEEEKKNGELLLNIAGNVVIELGEEVNKIGGTNHHIIYKADKNKPIIKEEHQDKLKELLDDKFELKDIKENIKDIENKE